jgi:hypothetical protein
MDFSFDLETLSIHEICDQITTTTEQTHNIIKLMILHLTAASNTDLENIPSPADQTQSLFNPFLYNAPIPSSSSLSSGMVTHNRHAQVKTVLDEELKRDKATFHALVGKLNDLIGQLYGEYPIGSNEDKNGETLNTLVEKPSLDMITIYNIADIPTPTINQLLSQISIRSRAEFSSYDEYIEYLKSHKRDLYKKVQKQALLISSLHQQAVRLQQSLALYRGQ